MELYVQREKRPREAVAARYQSGRPLGELEAVAHRAGDFEMTEIPHWRCLLVRTWLADTDPDYAVVADGHWLVFDVGLHALYTLTGEEFSGEFEPATPRADRLGLDTDQPSPGTDAPYLSGTNPGRASFT